MRQDEPTIESLNTATMHIVLAPDQCFKSTPKAYEIWEIDGLRVHRIPKARVLWETHYTVGDLIRMEDAATTRHTYG